MREQGAATDQVHAAMNLVHEARAAHLGEHQIQQFRRAGLEHLADLAAGDQAALLLELDGFLRGDVGVQHGAEADLDPLGGGDAAQVLGDFQVAGEVHAADGDHGRVEQGAVQEDAQVGEVLADVHHHGAIFAVLAAQDGLGAGQGGVHQLGAVQSRVLERQLDVHDDGARGHDEADLGLQRFAKHVHRVADVALALDVEHLRDAVEDQFLLGELAAVGGLLQHAVPVRGRDDLVAAGDGNGIAEVLALELDAVHGHADAVHLGLPGGAHGLFHGAHDGAGAEVHVRDLALGEAALGRGLAGAGHIERPVFLLDGHHRHHFACTEVES